MLSAMMLWVLRRVRRREVEKKRGARVGDKTIDKPSISRFMGIKSILHLATPSHLFCPEPPWALVDLT